MFSSAFHCVLIESQKNEDYYLFIFVVDTVIFLFFFDHAALTLVTTV